jgi:hypothetical protein
LVSFREDETLHNQQNSTVSIDGSLPIIVVSVSRIGTQERFAEKEAGQANSGSKP